MVKERCSVCPMFLFFPNLLAFFTLCEIVSTSTFCEKWMSIKCFKVNNSFPLWGPAQSSLTVKVVVYQSQVMIQLRNGVIFDNVWGRHS
jgi:hypothetical protein